MLRTCRWCSQTRNGDEAIKMHERYVHPIEYFADLADKKEEQARQLLEEAKELREKFSISSGQETK